MNQILNHKDKYFAKPGMSSGGEGQDAIKHHVGYENMGTHKSGPNPRLVSQAGPKADHNGHGVGLATYLGSESYGGPGRTELKPGAMKVVQPDNLHSK
ncbi:MAG: hypothetical protein KGL39_54405 [Patescibacteria group bacterium]|nr:hypothetical protein [Patescibacteria group bacterium]